MSEQESNVCAICGGIKRIEYMIGFEEGRPHDMRIESRELLPEGEWRLCPGHPEPVQKHDGNLGDGDKVSIWEWSKQYSDVVIDCEEGPEDNKHLTPKQTLSLRDWLIQESPTLERLAKEQAGG